jgi:hypothetical protein
MMVLHLQNHCPRAKSHQMHRRRRTQLLCWCSESVIKYLIRLFWKVKASECCIWCQKRFSTNFIQKRTHASFMVQISCDSSLSVPLGDLDHLDHLKILQWSLVITYVDKCCNNFVFVCKKFYVSSVFSELNSPVGTYVVSNLAQSNILEFHLSFNKAHNFKGVNCGPRLPFLCVVWKFHKNPIKPRFICAASSTSLTDVSKWLCSFFKAMFPTVK